MSPHLTTIEPVVSAAIDDDQLFRAEQVLEPGYFWTSKVFIEVKNQPDIDAKETLLLVELHEFEGKLHSVVLRYHPRHCKEGRYTFLIDEFVRSFDPCLDADAIRAAEQQAIMDRVGELQRELVETQSNPKLMLAAVQPQIDAAQKARDDAAGVNAARVETAARERERNLGKIHRRAARRSAANGNPIALPKVAVGTNVSQLLNAGIDESGVEQLRELADRQLVHAQAQATWLTAKTTEITETLKRLAPFAAEKAAVALARSSDAISRAAKIKDGIESLDLYTGKGVDVFEIRDGAPAATNIPLKIVQGKRYMDEELAAQEDIDDAFDWRSQPQFFNALATNQALLDQVFPSERCVVSMATTRHRRRRYERESIWESMMNELNNQLVFLLVRNGGKVHVVYSATPSHEAASRLFPTQDELGNVFRGVNGSRITLRDVEFGERNQRFGDLELHYRRFLILLCGLDHRMKLFGDFYPPEQQLHFMSAGFQAKYMDFYADDEIGFMLGDDLPHVDKWIADKNAMVQSGSRVFMTKTDGARSACPEMKRRTSLRFRDHQFSSPLLVSQEGHRCYLTLATRESYGRGTEPNVKCYLDGDGASEEILGKNWWLCLDGVKASEIQSYLTCRRHWSMGVSYLRLFRRLMIFLGAEAVMESEARAYLMEQATTHGGMPAAVAGPALDVAVRNWRAARRGAALPRVESLAELNEILSLLAPPGYLPPAIAQLVDEYLAGEAVAGSGRAPVLLTRAAADRYILYTTTNDADRAPYPAVLHWGWVRRVVLEPTKTARKLRVVTEGFDWLIDAIPASEIEIRRWSEALAPWLNKEHEPIKLRKYAQIKANLLEAAVWAETLRTGPGAGIPGELFDTLARKCDRMQSKEYRRILDLKLAIPVALTGGPRTLTMVYMTARAETVLWTYGDEIQREQIEDQFLAQARFGDRGRVKAILSDPFMWKIRTTDDVVDGSCSDVYKDKIPGGTKDRPWLKISVEKSWKRKHGTATNPGVKGDGKPHTSTVHAQLSLNRAFDEIAGVGPILRKSFNRSTAERAIRDTRYPYASFGRDDDGSKAKALRLKILSAAYEPPRSLLSPLIWSERTNRSTAQSVFDAPLRAAGLLKEDDYPC